ncbi:hypothetical protein AAF712_015992 [Marasmius tenuissimus]|uniref:Uncharacterized protein n=1 Tax=Marasmius tenuissimus TaxID=585030 RepID=A0ABR2Z8N9_9AGAR
MLHVPVVLFSPHSPYQQAGVMKSFPRRILLSALLFASCAAFNVTFPEQTPVNQIFKSQFYASKADFDSTSTGVIGIVLLVPPNPNITCPKGIAGIASGFEKIIDGFTFVQKPDNGSAITGDLLLTPQKEGPHILCAYANAPAFGSQGPSQTGDRSFDIDKLKDISLISNSTQFNVTPGPSSEVSSIPSPTMSPQSPEKDAHGGNRGQWGDHQKPDAAIVGGVVGGVAVICILIAFFFYRRFRYQKKLNQFHREHQLLHQTPPASIFTSTLTSPNHHLVYSAASPPPAGLRSPGSPATIRPRSNIPLGFDETMQKSYHFPSVGSSPSSHSIPLPHEPTLRAQHGPGIGASNV